MKTIPLFILLLLLSGCGAFSEGGALQADNEIRITEYGADISGIGIPVMGEGLIGGVRVVVEGMIPNGLKIHYQGVRVTVTFHCDNEDDKDCEVKQISKETGIETLEPVLVTP